MCHAHATGCAQEVQFLSFLQRSRMRAEMAAERAARDERDRQKLEAMRNGGVAPTDDAGDNFYQLLQEARDILPDNSWWVGNYESAAKA